MFFKKNKKINFISIDFGTRNTLVYVSGQGVIYNEPTVIAYKINLNSKKPYLIGSLVNKMIGKNHPGIQIFKPLLNGVIDNLDVCVDFIDFIFKKIKILNILKNSVLLLACPSGVTELEKNALVKLARKIGFNHIFIEEEVKMAALGIGVDIDVPKGNLVVDIGGGTTDIALIASGDIVLSRSTRTAGELVDEEIIKFYRAKYGISIGFQTAEKIKINCASLDKKYRTESSFVVFGRNVITGLPTSIKINNNEIREITQKLFIRIKDVIKEILEITSSELSSDIFINGIHFTGGCSQIPGIPEFFNGFLHVPIHVSQKPLFSVIRGAKKYEDYIINQLEG